MSLPAEGGKGSVAKLGVLAAIVLTAGNMIGSGLYLLPATLGASGSITILSWAIASGGALLLALVFGLLGVLRPTGDGVVAYAGQDLHPALGHGLAEGVCGQGEVVEADADIALRYQKFGSRLALVQTLCSAGPVLVLDQLLVGFHPRHMSIAK